MIRYLYTQKKSFPLYFLCILFLVTGLTFYPVGKCFSISNSDYFYRTPPKISDGLETASIYEANIDAEKLVALIHNVRNGSYKNIHGLLLTIGPNLPIFAEDMPVLKNSWRKLIDKGVKKIYPAHGKPFPVEKLMKKVVL